MRVVYFMMVDSVYYNELFSSKIMENYRYFLSRKLIMDSTVWWKLCLNFQKQACSHGRNKTHILSRFNQIKGLVRLLIVIIEKSLLKNNKRNLNVVYPKFLTIYQENNWKIKINHLFIIFEFFRIRIIILTFRHFKENIVITHFCHTLIADTTNNYIRKNIHTI